MVLKYKVKSRCAKNKKNLYRIHWFIVVLIVDKWACHSSAVRYLKKNIDLVCITPDPLSSCFDVPMEMNITFTLKYQ